MSIYSFISCTCSSNLNYTKKLYLMKLIDKILYKESIIIQNENIESVQTYLDWKKDLGLRRSFLKILLPCATEKHTAKSLVRRALKFGTRRRLHFAVHFTLAHGENNVAWMTLTDKPHLSCATSPTHGEWLFCRARPSRHTANGIIAVCFVFTVCC